MKMVYHTIGIDFPGNDFSCLHPFTFGSFFLAEKQSCGLEVRALRGKSIGGKRNPIGDLTVLPQDEAGPSGAQPVPPTPE